MLLIDIIKHLCYNAKVTVGGYAPQPLTSDEYTFLYSSKKGLVMHKHSVLAEKKTNLSRWFTVVVLILIALSFGLWAFQPLRNSTLTNVQTSIPEDTYSVSGTVESVSSIKMGKGEKSFLNSAVIVLTGNTQTYTCVSTTCVKEVKSGDSVQLQCSQDANQKMIDCSIRDVQKK
jgi:hypothetical protein